MALGDAQLRRSKEDAAAFPASDLWKDSPVLLVVLRRPGCLLCREQAVKLWSERAQFEASGVKLVCVVHEWIQREIDGFAPKYWGGELYYDEGKAFYAAVHGGKVKKGSLLALLNPLGEAWKNMKRAKGSGLVEESNMNGDGLTLGGLMIFKKGGDVAYSYPEKTFGDHAPFEKVLEEARKVGGS